MMMQSYQANVAHTTQNAAAPGFLSKYNYKIFFVTIIDTGLITAYTLFQEKLVWDF